MSKGRDYNARFAGEVAEFGVSEARGIFGSLFNFRKSMAGVQPNIVVEIDLDKCALNYGNSPCTASAIASLSCFNTFGTCQDVANYDNSDTLTLRFSLHDREIIRAENVFPVVERLAIAPAKLVPGKGLSSRHKLDITLSDFIDGDRLTDPYVDSRSYIASDQGTFFGKLLARNPHHIGRELRVKMGYAPTDGSAAALSDFDKTLTFIIDRIDGVDANGKVKIIAKDTLSLGDSLKRKIPEASTGTLASAINTATGSIPLESGAGADYAATTSTASVIRISNEIIYCTGRSGDTLTGGTRGYGGTTAAEAATGDSVQLCQEYGYLSTKRVDAVVEDLCLQAGISAASLPTGDWDREVDTWLTDYNLKNIISEPTEINKLLDQISVECGVDIWIDECKPAVRLKAQTPEQGTITKTVIDSDILQNKGAITLSIKDRLSQIYFYVGKKSEVGSDKDVGNFINVVVRVDADSEGENEYNQKNARKVFCQWLETTTQAGQQASRILKRYVEPPRRLKATLDISKDEIQTGDHFLLQSELSQDIFGGERLDEHQMLSVAYNIDQQTVSVESLAFRNNIGRYAYVAPTGQGDYDASTTGDQASYSWIATTDTVTVGAASDDPYLII